MNFYDYFILKDPIDFKVSNIKLSYPGFIFLISILKHPFQLTCKYFNPATIYLNIFTNLSHQNWLMHATLLKLLLSSAIILFSYQ